MRSQEDRIRTTLEELSQALIQALAASPEVTGVARKIREEGYSVYLALTCRHEREAHAQIELTPRRPAPEEEPVFRLDGNDVALLKSLGIDPTRPARRRRSSAVDTSKTISHL